MVAPGVRLTINQESALAEVGRLIARAEHPRPMFDQIGMSLVTSTQRRFETGVGPDGVPWPPSLRALAEGGKTLIESARLWASITFAASDAGVEEGTNVIYAAIQQFGGRITQAARTAVLHFKRTRKGTRFAKANKRATFAKKVEVGPRVIVIPARPFIGLDDDDTREIVRIAEDWMRPREARA
jgi:phage gpG-like protein